MNDPAGSKWRRWDLHFHTPASFDHKNKSATPKELVERLLDSGISVVALTDHHTLDCAMVEAMREEAGTRLIVLPGIEFACPLGGKEGVHFIGIFPENADLNYLRTEVLSRSGINRQRAEGKTDEQIYVEFRDTCEVIRELSGVVSIHGHGKASSIEGIANNSAMKMQFKEDVLRDDVDLLEIGNHERVKDYRDIVFPSIGFQLPLVVGSDDHGEGSYPKDRICWIKADPTFAGLRMAMRQPQLRICLEDTPPQVVRLEAHKTKYVRSIAFSHLGSMPSGENWMSGEIPLNPGLVAIIGNKGSGKSALADCVGLLGSCSTSDAFSFLESDRFLHPRTGRAQHVACTMEWHDGAPAVRLLSESIPADDPERVKYLPQRFVEKVCNDLASPGGGDFEKELKKVVFSKVSPIERLGKHTLDELLGFRTEAIRKQADELVVQLRSLCEERASFEVYLNPAVATGLRKRLAQKEEEIRSHQANRPADREPPASDPNSDPNASAEIARLTELRTQKTEVHSQIENWLATEAQQSILAATAEKLLEKLSNTEKAVRRLKDELAEDARALGLDPDVLVSVATNTAIVARALEEALAKATAAREAIDGSDSAPGLAAQESELDRQIAEVSEKLSRPQQEYQAFLEAKEKWESSLERLQGSPEESESLQGLQAQLAKLALVPAQLRETREKQYALAAEIHALRVRECEVYTTLYRPVQRFVSEHPLASDQLKLEFKVDLVQERFDELLLEFINQNRVGSFYGVEDGARMARRLTSAIAWADWPEVRGFLESVEQHLAADMRRGEGNPVLLSDQLISGKAPADLHEWVFSLSYLTPRYLLRWDGKDVGQLSPGERGTLLLIFYLLIDDSDLPLVIDQPEANLDNFTVAEKLVHCINDARQRRQVMIVTHNPNLAVVCDADQIIYARFDKTDGNRIVYETGALESPSMNRFTIDVLEGGRAPFNIRDVTYKVVGS